MRLIRQSISNLLERGFYGLDDVRLEWRDGLGKGGSEARWSRCGEGQIGTCAWRFGPFGLAWSGELELGPGEAKDVAVVPTVVGAEGEPVELWRWPGAIFPTVPFDGGPRRRVKAGGRLLGDCVEVWVNDRGQNRSWVLDAKKVRGRDSEEKCPAHDGGVSTEWLDRLAPWPSSAWPAIVVHVLGTLFGRVKIPFSTEKVGRGYIQVLVGNTDERLKFVIFRRLPGSKFRSTGRFSYSYQAERGGQVDLAVEIVERCLRKAEQQLDRLAQGL